MEFEEDESQSSGCVTETEEDDSTSSSTNDLSIASSNSNLLPQTASEQVGRLVVEKTELAPILEDEVLEIEPTPTVPPAAVAHEVEEHTSLQVPVQNNGGGGGNNGDLPPLYEADETGDATVGWGGVTSHIPHSASQHGAAESASLFAPFDDNISITTSTDFHRPRFSVVGGHTVDFSHAGIGGGDDDEDDPDRINLPYQGAPNGGYGWVITLLSFLSFFVIEGIFFSFGIFFPEFMAYFHHDASVVSWVGSVGSGASYLVGPMASIFVNTYGLRPSAIIGCIIGFLSLGFSVIAPNIYCLIFSWGIGFGIASTIATIPCHFALSLWFNTKRGLATGLALAGGGLGGMIFPHIASLIIMYNSWKLAMILFSMLFLFLTFSSVFIKSVPPIQLADSRMNLSDVDEPMEINMFHNPGRLRLQAFRKAAFSINSTATNSVWRLSQENVTGGQSSINDITTIGRSQFSIENSHNHPFNDSANIDNDRKLSSYSNFMKHFLWNQNRKPGTFLNLEDISGSQSMFDSKTDLPNRATPLPAASPGLGATQTNIPEAELKESEGETERQRRNRRLVPPRRPLRRLDIFYSGSTLALEKAPRSIINLNKSTWTFTGVERSAMNLRDRVDEALGSKGKLKSPKPESMMSSVVTLAVLADMLNFKLLRQTSFSMFLLAHFILMLGFFVPYVYLPALAKTVLKNVTTQEANYLIPAIGLTNTIGRLVMGVVGDSGWIDPCYLNSVSLLACAIGTLAVPFTSTYFALCAYAFFFGFCCASIVSLRSLAVVSLVGLQNLTSAFGLVLFIQGVGALLGLPLTSVIANAFESPFVPFYAAGVTFLVAALLFIPLKPISVWEIRRFQRKEALSELEEDERKLDQQEKENERLRNNLQRSQLEDLSLGKDWKLSRNHSIDNGGGEDGDTTVGDVTGGPDGDTVNNHSFIGSNGKMKSLQLAAAGVGGEGTGGINNTSSFTEGLVLSQESPNDEIDEKRLS